jgi:4-oxalocrotonate tautomerase
VLAVPAEFDASAVVSAMNQPKNAEIREILLCLTGKMRYATKEKHMPHIIVKLYPGRTEQQKIRLAEQIVQDVISTLNSHEDSVSVAFEEVKPEDWTETVYKPDIANQWDKLYKKPGYTVE